MNDRSGVGGWLGQNAVMEWISCCHQGEEINGKKENGDVVPLGMIGGGVEEI